MNTSLLNNAHISLLNTIADLSQSPNAETLSRATGLRLQEVNELLVQLATYNCVYYSRNMDNRRLKQKDYRWKLTNVGRQYLNGADTGASEDAVLEHAETNDDGIRVLTFAVLTCIDEERNEVIPAHYVQSKFAHEIGPEILARYSGEIQRSEEGNQARYDLQLVVLTEAKLEEYVQSRIRTYMRGAA